MAKWRDVKQNRGLEEKSTNFKIKSPKNESSSSPTGVEREVVSWEIR